MHALANIALRAANDAAEALAHASERLDRITIIDNNPDSFVTSLDENADKTIRYHIQKAFPTHSINSRISGFKKGVEKSTVWLIDPLVGGQNLAVGYPAYGVSVACQINGVVNHAVFVIPGLREEIVASRGKGAQHGQLGAPQLVDLRRQLSAHGREVQAEVEVEPGARKVALFRLIIRS